MYRMQAQQALIDKLDTKVHDAIVRLRGSRTDRNMTGSALEM